MYRCLWCNSEFRYFDPYVRHHRRFHEDEPMRWRYESYVAKANRTARAVKIYVPYFLVRMLGVEDPIKYTLSMANRDGEPQFLILRIYQHI